MAEFLMWFFIGFLLHDGMWTSHIGVTWELVKNAELGEGRWWRRKMGRSPGSPQIHQKFIRTWNNSYKANSRWQQQTPGLQGNSLSSLKWGRRKEGDIKREKMENFWAGACAPREGESPETGVPEHRETPSQAGPKGRCTVLKNEAQRECGGQ